MRAPVCIASSRVLLPSGHVAPASITIEGSTIARVDAHVPTHATHLGDRLITPAFVNAHTHLPMAALRGLEGCAQAMSGDVVSDLFFRVERHMTADDAFAFCRMGAYECLLSGVGLVWEHYYHGEALAAALLQTGLAGVVCPTLQDVTGPGVPLLERAFEETRSIHHDSSLRAAGIFAALGPHASDTVSAGLWRRVVRTAEQLDGLPVHFHIAQSIEEVTAVTRRSGGLPPLHWLQQLGLLSSQLPLLLVHGNFLSGPELQLLGAPHHVLCSCPRSHALFAFPAPILRWQQHGLPIALATDAAASNDDMNVQREMRHVSTHAASSTTFSLELDRLLATPLGSDAGFARGGQPPSAHDALSLARAVHARRQAAHADPAATALRDPRTLLRMVWETPGSLHPSFEAGALRRGALANLLIWDEKHPSIWPASDPHHSLVMCDATAAIDGMIVAGNWVGRPLADSREPQLSFQHSITKSAAYREARTLASERLAALLERAGLAVRK